MRLIMEHRVISDMEFEDINGHINVILDNY